MRWATGTRRRGPSCTAASTRPRRRRSSSGSPGPRRGAVDGTVLRWRTPTPRPRPCAVAPAAAARPRRCARRASTPSPKRACRTRSPAPPAQSTTLVVAHRVSTAARADLSRGSTARRSARTGAHARAVGRRGLPGTVRRRGEAEPVVLGEAGMPSPRPSRTGRTVARLVGWSALGCAACARLRPRIEPALDRGFLAGRSPVGVAWLVPLAVAGVVGRVRRPADTPLVGELRRAVPRPVGAPRDRRRAAPGDVGRAGGVDQRPRSPASSARPTWPGTSVPALLAQTFDAGRDRDDGDRRPRVAGAARRRRRARPGGGHARRGGAVVPTLARRTRRLLRADEALAATSTTVAVARRDIAACGARPGAARRGAASTGGPMPAGRSPAPAALRSAVSTIGGNLPLLLLLAAAPWLIEHGGLTVGGLIGAIVYVSASLQPACAARPTRWRPRSSTCASCCATSSGRCRRRPPRTAGPSSCRSRRRCGPPRELRPRRRGAADRRAPRPRPRRRHATWRSSGRAASASRRSSTCSPDCAARRRAGCRSAASASTACRPPDCAAS